LLHSRKVLRRRATTTLEAAVIVPVMFLLLLAIMVGAMGVFKYHAVNHAARETARFAAVHAAQYAKKNAAAIAAGTLPTVDANYLVNYAKSQGFTLDPDKMDVKVQMMVVSPGATSPDTVITVDWDDIANNQNRSPYSVWTNNATVPPSNVQVDNVVIVQITYRFSPGLFFTGSYNLTSTAVMPMSY